MIGEELTPITEDDNEHDKHTVTIRKNSYLVGQVPGLLSKVAWLTGDLALI